MKVRLIILLALLILFFQTAAFAQPETTPATQEAAGQPSVDSAPQPSVDSALRPNVEPVPEPAPEPTPDSTPEPTPEPTAELSPQPSTEQTPEPTAAPTLPTIQPEPTVEATPEPTLQLPAVQLPAIQIPWATASPSVSATPTPVKKAPEPTATKAEPEKTPEKTKSAQSEQNKSGYDTKVIFAHFTDENGKGISSADINIETKNGRVSGKTNSTGRAEFKQIPYGYTVWEIEGADDFELTFKKGDNTYADDSSLNECVVYASNSAQKLYLTFKAKGDGFILEDASESNTGSLSMLGLVLIIIIIAAGVIITIALVKRFSEKPPKDFRQEPDYQGTARGTGGRNKLGRRDGNYNDKSRL